MDETQTDLEHDLLAARRLEGLGKVDLAIATAVLECPEKTAGELLLRRELGSAMTLEVLSERLRGLLARGRVSQCATRHCTVELRQRPTWRVPS